MTTMQKILHILADRNMSVSDLAAATGISKQSFTNWKKGYNDIKESNLGKIASALQVPSEMLHEDSSEIIYSKNELTIIDIFRSVTAEQQSDILDYILRYQRTN